MDVFETEPLPTDHSIWKNEKVTITPHVSAVSSPQLVATVFVDNLALFAEGQGLKCCIAQMSEFAKRKEDGVNE